MLISGLTTAAAVAAVIAAIAYRVFNSGGSNAETITQGTAFLPKGAHVDAVTISGERIVVTLEVRGASQVRIFDLKTLRQTGQLNFATER